MATYWIRSRPTRIEIYRRHDRKAQSIKHKELKGINQRMKAGEALDVCLALAEALKNRLRDEEKAAGLAIPENGSAVEQAWKAKKKTKLVDPNSAYRDLVRAADAIGELKIETASEQDLQNYIDDHYTGNKHIKIAMGLNQLLAFLKRPIALTPADPELVDVPYITLTDLLVKLKTLEDPIEVALFGCLFGTGVRYSESFCINRPQAGFVHVDKQYAWSTRLKAYQVRGRKNKKWKPSYDAFVLPELLEHVEAWCAVPDRFSLRSRKFWKVCKKHFGITIHGFRHSYAIHLASQRYTKSQIADNLGDSEKVVKDYYNKHIQADPQKELMRSMYKRTG